MKMYFKKKVPDFEISKYEFTIVLLQSFCFPQKFALSCTGTFYKNSLIVTCCTFCRFEIPNLTPNRFKNETNGTLTLIAYNCNLQQGFLKQQIVAPHRCGFNLKFPKHFY